MGPSRTYLSRQDSADRMPQATRTRSAGSQWLRAGIAAKVVSEWLGHCPVAFTMDVYCDILESLE